uniref:Retrovirus-related Pol polyprotein from transposon TNT 1-94 n=1 Tax=Cajanus cajan TaxID=3821 RepID=A0A151TWG9_CAJCA|nr:Retrovirus-related Pol polyprotein from transposon TNT 1-94 [Cajanus cajan]
MTGSFADFTSYKKADKGVTITVADSNSSMVAGTGDLNLSGLKLKSFLYVPELKYSLISASILTKDLNCAIVFYPSHCIFQDLSSGMMIGNAKEHNGLYFVSNSPSKSDSSQTTSLSTVSVSNVFLCHNRLGHPNFNYLKHLYLDLFINKNISSFTCEHCILAKQSRTNYPSHPYQPSQPFHLIHSDIWGPSRIPNINGARWFITFIDDHTRMCWVYHLKEKSEANTTFKQFHKLVTNIFGSSIHILRTNNGAGILL